MHPTTAPALAQAAASAIEKAGSALPEDAMQWMLVYEANPTATRCPNGNTTMTCTTNCVPYNWNAVHGQVRLRLRHLEHHDHGQRLRQRRRAHSVGVAINARHTWITGLFGNGVDLNERSVMQFEPLPNETCKPAHN